jgi:YfiR/HmsC-like
MLALCLLCFPDPASAQDYGMVNPYRVEAAFLRNFAHYVRWPAGAFTNARSPWRVGILGRDPFGNILEQTFRGHVEQGRPFETYRGDTPEELPPCHIVFIAYRDPSRRRAALARFNGKPVLTVGEASNFLQEGGIIRFEVTDRVKMSINLDKARSASLKIQTTMLEVSDEVLDHGRVQRLR